MRQVRMSGKMRRWGKGVSRGGKGMHGIVTGIGIRIKTRPGEDTITVHYLRIGLATKFEYTFSSSLTIYCH